MGLNADPPPRPGRETRVERSQLQDIREAIRQLPPEDLDRHLPNLIQTIRTASSDEPETVRFHIGVSFTQELTPLDYRIDQVVIPPDRDHTRVKSLKTRISRDHYYLSFPYPPDTGFSPSTLRGAILASIEHEIVYSNYGNVDSGTNASNSIFARITEWVKK